MRPLDPHEKNLLRGIEEHLVLDDPVLAEQLRSLRPRLRQRLAPANWPPNAYWTISAVMMGTGLVLGDGASLVGGMLMGAGGCLRRWGRS